ncbi:MAG: DNA primase, partial [Candidatus Moranbacteria bacterium]|nr:DNA primase [Candidatus Moranbacteria bacterium]
MNEIEEIKSKINIIDFIGEYIRLTRAGSSFKGLCPFHNEKTPSFNVSEERQRFHCFGCGKGGDIFTFLMEMEGLEFREALETLAERAGVEHKKGSTFSQEKNTNTKNIYTLLQEATSFYEKQLWEEQGVKALSYVKARGIDDEILKQFRIGFAPFGWHTTQTFLLSSGFNEQDIINAGLVVQKEEDTSSSKKHTYDRFRERIMFPVFDPLGRVVGYSARVLPGENEKNAKYINTPETSVYHKSRIMYGLFQAKEYIKKERKVIVVEGNMDVLAMHKSGFKNTVAVSGTSLTQEHFILLKRYAREVVFFFDSDVAGQQAMKKSV